MNKELLSDALDGLDQDLIDEHFRMKERRRLARRMMPKLIKTAAAAAVIVLLAVGAMSPQITGSMTIGGFFDQVFRPGGDVTVNEVTTEEVLEAPWERLNMALGVKNGLIRAGSYNTKIAMTVRYADTSIPDDFMYEGKSYSEYVAERDALRARNEELKAQEQTDGVKEEIAQNKKKIVEIADCITSAANAYKMKCAEEIYQLFEEKGCQVIRTGAILHLRASYRELSKLVIEGSETLYFDVGYESVFLKEEESEVTDVQTEVPLDACLRKVKSAYADEKINLKDKGDLEKYIESIIQKGDGNRIKFIIGCSTDFDIDVLKELNYYYIKQNVSFVTVEVYKEDINIDVLIEIIKRSDIVKVVVSLPDGVIPDSDITQKKYLDKVENVYDDYDDLEDEYYLALVLRDILMRNPQGEWVEITIEVKEEAVPIILEVMPHLGLSQGKEPNEFTIKMDYDKIDSEYIVKWAKKDDALKVKIGPVGSRGYLKKITSGSVSTAPDLKDEGDLVEFIESMSQGEGDHLLFIIFCPENIDEGIFENMDFYSFSRQKYPSCVTLGVKKEDINIDALIELAKRSDIGGIIISFSRNPV